MSTTIERFDSWDDDAIVIDIARIAERRAREIVGEQRARDLAHDVVLECLVKLRAGTWKVAVSSLQAFVCRMVRRRAIDAVRRSQRSDVRNGEHARERREGAHAWMSPELAMEERELLELHGRTLASLPSGCRRAYVMVREEEATYEAAAERLGLSPATVNVHVVSRERAATFSP
jgi:RNA polymerase sigma factor (sigma-70 family)